MKEDIFLQQQIFSLLYFTIAQFRYINIQPQTIDFSTRLWGINYWVCGVYSPEPLDDVYCFKLNFKISKLAYLLYLMLLRPGFFNLSDGECGFLTSSLRKYQNKVMTMKLGGYIVRQKFDLLIYVTWNDDNSSW